MFILFAAFLHKSNIWEKFDSEIWVKMLSANNIAGHLSQVYLYKKMLKKSDFLDVDADS